ncbi:MAG TPA: alkaline phosphatase [Bryobacteraceae bacterium]|nr:alkaline phosphatase [Bryobacteraceae bacterium]
MRLLVLLSGFALLSSAARVEHVVLIGVDGLAPAGIESSETPVLHRLRDKGAWTFHARAVIPTVSSPNWASMVMGAGPAQHGITSNEWQTDKFEIPPTCKAVSGLFPSVYDLLKQQRPSATIGIFHHWDGYARLVGKGVPTIVEHRKTAPETMAEAIAWWKKVRPTFLFVHLDHVDDAGHTYAWESSEFKTAVASADQLIGDMVAAIDDSGLGSNTLLLVTADHGGIGKKHGGLTMAELEIPWIAVGPNVRNAELRNPVDTYDTAATIADALGLDMPQCWIARPVKEMWK